MNETTLIWNGPHKGGQLDFDYFTGILPPNTPGLYVWRKVLRNNDQCIYDPAEFLKWIENSVDSPLFDAKHLRVDSSRGNRVHIRSNFISIESLTVGGGSLPQGKREHLNNLAEDPKRLNQLYSFFQLASLSFGPVLYVGESNNLIERFRQHLADGSPLRQRLSDLNLDIADTALYFCVLRNFNVEHRQALESALTHISVAPLTYRPG